jgi:hypothetical protein
MNRWLALLLRGLLVSCTSPNRADTKLPVDPLLIIQQDRNS